MLRTPSLLLVFQMLAIPMVLGLFRLPIDKAVISLMASAVFLTIALVTIFYAGPYKRIVRVAGFQFLFIAVIPVLILRIKSWGNDFNTTLLLGGEGRDWHKIANISYLLMLSLVFLVYLALAFRQRR